MVDSVLWNEGTSNGNVPKRQEKSSFEKQIYDEGIDEGIVLK